MMNKFVFVDKRESSPTAFAKVATDIVRVLDGMGFRHLPLNHWEPWVRGTTRAMGYLWLLNAWRILGKIHKDDVVVLQYPDVAIRWERFGLSLLKWMVDKGAKLVVLIHDIDMPRFKGDVQIAAGHEFVLKVVEHAHAIIVHNTAMRKWFKDRGVEDSRIIELGVFDYLASVPLNHPDYSTSVIVAGNLSPNKAAYASQLKEIDGVHWKVYSGYFDVATMGGENIEYCGTCPSDEFPKKLTSGFGLVWDGDSVDDCVGPAGEYTLTVSPHKLSLYLASGLPVIVNEGAAIAAFVKDNQVGVAVKSLRDLPEKLKAVTSDQYAAMTNNCQGLAKKLRDGYFTKQAIESAIRRIAV